jgi:hypothetical protein
LEQLCIIFQNVGSQFVQTCITLLNTTSPPLLCILISNATTLLSQLESSLCICDTYSGKFPHFCTVSKLLSPTDHAFLIKTITTNCSTLWSLLKSPSTPAVRNTIIVFLSHLDTFLTQYLTSSLTSISLFQFCRPRVTANPSVIHQVSSTEIMINPYWKSLCDNYYFPLSDMTVEMQIDSPSSSSGTTPLSPALGGTATVLQNKRKITIEDSVEVISELIAEIQASKKVDIDLASSSNSPQSTVKTHPTLKAPLTICFSLARQKRVGGSLPNNLSSLKKFFHVLLSTKAVSILPVRVGLRRIYRHVFLHFFRRRDCMGVII